MRFTVTYRIFADSEKLALARAADVALEQTVEIPEDVVPAGYIADEIVGQIEHVEGASTGAFDVKISYSPDSVSDELPQLLNVIFGNTSIQKNIKAIGLDLGETLAARFPGPRIGIKGVRERAGRPRGGLIAPVIKPQGLSAEDLADIAYRCAVAGADIIKEDHGLTNQKMAPFKDRCEKISAAVRRANTETGGSSLYFPNLAGQTGDLMTNAHFAKEAGAGGFLVMPGLLGFDVVNRLASDPDLNLPIMTHPSFLGPFVLSDTFGFSHAMMFGVIPRLAGADISIFPNVGGRFGFSREECQSISSACTNPGGIGKTIFPSPGGGMNAKLAADMISVYGEDAVFLFGGSLMRYGDRIGEGVSSMRQALDEAVKGF